MHIPTLRHWILRCVHSGSRVYKVSNCFHFIEDILKKTFFFNSRCYSANSPCLPLLFRHWNRWQHVTSSIITKIVFFKYLFGWIKVLVAACGSWFPDPTHWEGSLSPRTTREVPLPEAQRAHLENKYIQDTIWIRNHNSTPAFHLPSREPGAGIYSNYIS